MQLLQTWDRTSAFEPTNPNQQPLQYYSPAAMSYQSAYWNERPTTAKNLMGLMPTNRYAQAGVALAAVAAAYFGYQEAKKRKLFGLAGLAGPKRARNGRFKRR